MKKSSLWPAFLCSAISFVSIAGFSVWFIYSELHRPVRSFPEEARIVVRRGQSSRAIARDLETAGAISSATLMGWYLRWKGPEFYLKAGEYRFREPLSLIDVAHAIHRGDVHRYRITLPEGLTVAEIADRLETEGFGSSQDFLGIGSRPDLISDLDPDAEDLEGYLFPETYHFTLGTSATSIVARLVREFRQVWTEPLQQRAQEAGLTLRQVMTLASLIEKETGRASERPLISAVFHNRLKRGMKLECDPTVIYAVSRVKEYDGIIHRSDLELDSPYNTYRYPGLPPGPIANPGLASIEAALSPAPVDFLFFVSRNDGSHIFSKSYRDHHKAVLAYQR